MNIFEKISNSHSVPCWYYMYSLFLLQYIFILAGLDSTSIPNPTMAAYLFAVASWWAKRMVPGTWAALAPIQDTGLEDYF